MLALSSVVVTPYVSGGVTTGQDALTNPVVIKDDVSDKIKDVFNVMIVAAVAVLDKTNFFSV